MSTCISVCLVVQVQSQVCCVPACIPYEQQLLFPVCVWMILIASIWRVVCGAWHVLVAFVLWSVWVVYVVCVVLIFVVLVL